MAQMIPGGYLYPVANRSDEVRIPFVGTEPMKGRPEDAARDLRALRTIEIEPGEWQTVQTGLQVGIPEGYLGLVLPRSGLALTYGITVLNAPGLIDPGYTGDVSVVLLNLGKHTFRVAEGDRIAQLVILKNTQASFEHALNPKQGTRGDQGFGSSGVA